MPNARILVVEDEAVVAKDLEVTLNRLGYAVPAVASSGEDAIERAAETLPDLVLMDIRLQGETNGVEAAEQIRTRFDIPVVFLTAYADEDTIARAKLAEPFGYILKPFEANELRSAIELAIYKHRMEKELKESEERYRTIVETAQEGIWVLDSEDKTTLVNARMAEMLGYAIDEMMEVSFFDFADEEWRTVAEVRARGWRSGGVGRYVLKFRRKDGAGVWAMVSTNSRFDRDGRYSGALAMVADITRLKDALAEVEESKDFVENVIASMKDGFVILDNRGFHLDVNVAFCQMTGFTREELIGTGPPHPYWPEEEYKSIEDAFQRAQTGQREDYELVFRTKDGLRFPVVLSSACIRDKEGDIVSFFAAVRDVTERKRAEDALRESERRFRGLFDHMSSGVIVYEAQDEGRDFVMRDINRAGERISRVKRGDIVGRSVLEVFPGIEEFGLFGVLQRVWTSGEPQRHPVSQYKDDRLSHWAENYAYKLPSGEVVAVYDDVTERKHAEDALRESEARYQELFDQAPVGYHELDTEGRIVRVNRTELDMLGYTRGQMLGRPVWEFIVEGEDVREHVLAKLTGAAPVGRGFERMYRRKDGGSLPVLIEDRILRDAAGQIIGIRSTIQDITARKRAEEALHAHQRRLRSMAAELSRAEERERRRIAAYLHDEIGQTLVAVRMKLGALQAARGATDAGIIGEIDGLLERVLQDTRSLTIELSPPILYELGLEPTLEWLAERISEEYDIRVDFDDDGLAKPLDDDVRVLLYGAVRELLMNVVRHAQARRGKVAISRDGEQVRIVVEDDGVGFEPDKVASVMPGHDAGFGLFSVRERIEHVGGRIEIESEPGHGTRVTLFAPLKGDDSPC